MKVVLPVAGIGKRLFPATKTIPKELLPIFSKISKNSSLMVPTIQIIFQQMFQNKIKKFYFITRQDEKLIKEYFTSKYNYQNNLDSEQKKDYRKFLKTIRKSNITWIIQKKPIGFGNAVHLAERYVGKDDFIVHASDTVIISKKKHPVSRFREIAKNNPKISAIILCKKVKDPRRFGVLELKKISGHLYNVTGVEEKPSKPKSKNIILGLYYFKPIIFDALKKIKLGHGNEYQLTDAIKLLIANGEKVLAVELEKDEIDLDIGTLESYKNALTISYNQKILKQNNMRGI